MTSAPATRTGMVVGHTDRFTYTAAYALAMAGYETEVWAPADGPRVAASRLMTWSGTIAEAPARALELGAADRVVIADARGTRALQAFRDRVAAPVLGVDASTFDRFNDKASLLHEAAALNLPVPPTTVQAPGDPMPPATGRYIARSSLVDGLPPHISDGAPTDLWQRRPDLAAAGPVVVQPLIRGYDIDFCAWSEDGEVRAWFTFDRPPGTGMMRFHRCRRVFAAVAPLLAAHQVSGITNWDLRIDWRGRPWILECNPRMWGGQWEATLHGLDLVAAWLADLDGKRGPLLRRPGWRPNWRRALLHPAPGWHDRLRRQLVDPVTRRNHATWRRVDPSVSTALL